jgi:hypothetical protein
MRDVQEVLAECITRLGRRAQSYTLADVRAVMIGPHPAVRGVPPERQAQWRTVQLVMKDDTQSAPTGCDRLEAFAVRQWAVARQLPYSG